MTITLCIIIAALLVQVVLMDKEIKRLQNNIVSFRIDIERYMMTNNIDSKFESFKNILNLAKVYFKHLR